MRSDPVIIGIATFDGPGRRESLRGAVESLECQADEVHVYLNDISLRGSMDWLPASGETVLVYHERDYGDIGDAGKFADFFEGFKNDFYCLTCDDDLIYPPDYVERMIEGIERYDRQAVVSFHGKAFTEKAYPWLRAPGARYRCLGAVEQDAPITIPGTGVMGWHSSLLTLSLDDFPAPNMADIWMGKKCNDLGVPRYVLAHEAGWIRHADIDLDTTLARINLLDERKKEYITDVYNSVNWKL